MSKGLIVGMGGGASLNYKIIGGTSRPSSGGGDTLTWDGNTDGLVSVDATGEGVNSHWRVTEEAPSLNDLSNGVVITWGFAPEEPEQYEATAVTDTLFICGEMQVLIAMADTDVDGLLIPKGVYFFKGSEEGLFISSLTIPGYTGFGGGGSVKENTIWVDTNTKITSHAFSATEPTNPVEGMVWFKTGASGSVVFNALKKNIIEVCVTGCQQYVSGAWASKTSQAYIGGKWRDFYVFLYNKGDFCESVTGGWESKSGKISLDTAKAPTITKNEDSVTIAITGYGEGYYKPVNKIDLTNVSKLVWDADVTVSYKVRLRVFASSLTTEAAELSYSSTTSKKIHELDVSSLSGEYYVAICIATGNSGKSTVTMRDLRME